MKHIVQILAFVAVISLQSCSESDPLGYRLVVFCNNSPDTVYAFVRNVTKMDCTLSDCLKNAQGDFPNQEWRIYAPREYSFHNIGISTFVETPFLQTFVIKKSTFDRYGLETVIDGNMADYGMSLTLPQLKDGKSAIVYQGESQWQHRPNN